MIGKEEPRDYKSQWPPVGAFISRIEAIIRQRKPTAEEESAARWLRYIERAKAEGVEAPDDETLQRIEALNSRFDMKRTPEAPRDSIKDVICPHCQNQIPIPANMRFWTTAEMRTMADTLDELARIAEVNRNQPQVAVDEPVEAFFEGAI